MMVTMTGHEDIEPFPGSRAFAVDDPAVSFIFEGPWGKILRRCFPGACHAWTCVWRCSSESLTSQISKVVRRQVMERLFLILVDRSVEAHSSRGMLIVQNAKFRPIDDRKP